MNIDKTISVSLKPKSGPWGGGASFVKYLVNTLKKEGFSVVHNLNNSVDLVFLINPRRRSSEYSFLRLRWFLKRHPQVKLVFRINECDKRKGTNEIDKKIVKAAAYADHIIFISDWLKQYFYEKYPEFPKNIQTDVIYNGVDTNIYNNVGYSPWKEGEKMKLVTHHWSNHWLKGFDVYTAIDKLLGGELGQHFSFSYIGNKPDDVDFVNSNYIEPKQGKKLADILKQHHVYVTASQWEPCGMHQLEGGMCGLPIMYTKEGGGIVDTCRDYGLLFDRHNVKEGMQKMKEQYDSYREKMQQFPFTKEKMLQGYLGIINRQ